MNLCTCKSIEDRTLTVLRCIQRAEMRDGSHTSFYLMRCDVCKGLWGWPQKNFTMALDGGWDPNAELGTGKSEG